mmetsp:Transcript_7748/g.11504  ORF Transcript_7748/g.11504 Transcript_7748/m.11504 type:complete len:1128 (+) Transcript_7748:67-3450(+)
MATRTSSSKNSDTAKSISVLDERDSDHDIENEEDGFEAALGAKVSESAWASGGQQRDHIIQILLNLVSNFGVYHAANQDSSNSYQKVFYKGSYAIENVNGLRQFMRDMEDPISRDIMIRISKYEIMEQYIVPLFCLSLDDRALAMPLIRLFLLLTKPPSPGRAAALKANIKIKSRRAQESAEEADIRIKKELSDRDNAYEQVAALLTFKRALVSDDVFNIILLHAAEPLLKEPRLRSEDDKKIIECTLMLISNLLAIESGPLSPSSDKVLSHSLQNKLTLLLADEFFGIILLLCQTVMDKVNRPWNLILVEIVYYLLRNRDPKDLVRVNDLKEENIRHSAANKRRSSGPIAGKLHNALAREREERLSLTSGAAGNRMNRFGGVFRVPAVVANSEPGSGGSCRAPQLARDASALLDPSQIRRPQAMRRRTKSSCTFIQGTGQGTDSKSFLVPSLSGSTAEAQQERQVLRAIAGFMDTLMEAGFGELVYSVKEGWRREDPMKPAEELMYLSMVTCCLRYQRIKVQAEHRQRFSATHGNSESQPAWNPELKNVTQCFDRMSIMRPVDAIVKIREESKEYDKLVVPMELYKELTCFLRIMLESENPAHNDIALGALYKIFYMSYSERMDPVLSLLRDWKPGTFSRHHLDVLIELVHETMKLLDTADYCFKHESTEEGIAEAKKRRKKKDAAAEDERSQYLAAALRFDPHEYFRRLVSNNTIRIYTRALEQYSSNTQHTNHYIFVFLQRLCSYKFEDDNISRTSLDPNNVGKEVTLGHLLFNLQTLNVFNSLLGDKAAATDKSLEPMLRLIRGIVRRFGEEAERNHMMFVEAVFQHAHALSTWQRISGIYDAYSIAKGSLASDSVVDMNEKGSANESDSEDMGDEFDENNSDLMKITINPSELRKKKRRESRKRRRREPVVDSEDSTDEEELSRPRKGSRRPWSEEEDSVLRTLYALYNGSNSTFTAIAEDPRLSDLGGRSVLQVTRRVRELNLHLERHHKDDNMVGHRENVGKSAGSDNPKSQSLDNSQVSADPNGDGAEAVAFWEIDNEADINDERWQRIMSTTVGNHHGHSKGQGGGQRGILRRANRSEAMSDSENDEQNAGLFESSECVEARSRLQGPNKLIIDSDDE